MGRGFAVVASEVKGLASQTSRATEDVSRRISEIQGISNRSTGQLRDVVQLIEQMKQFSVAVAAAAEEQSSATNSIAENVNSAADRSEEARASVAAMATINFFMVELRPGKCGDAAPWLRPARYTRAPQTVLPLLGAGARAGTTPT